MKKMIFALVFSAVGAALAADVTEFDTKDLIGVSVSVPSGKVSVEAHDGAKASVAFTKNKFSEHCKLTIERKENRIVVKVEKSPRFFSLGDCDANYEIKVPKKTDSDVKLGSGNINIKGVQGEVLFSLGSGEVAADGSFAKVDGKTGSGPIQISGLSGNANLRLGSGSVNLTYSVKPANGATEIQLGSGDSTLTFPKGSKIKTTFVAGVGKLHNELSDSADASYLVSVKTGSGSLSIKAH